MIRLASSKVSSFPSNLIEDNFRNYIINGDFSINQRSFTTSTTTAAFGFDRWFQTNSGGTVTVSSQSITPGSPPQAGFESSNHIRITVASQTGLATDTAYVSQRIEDVRSLASSPLTISFWAKANTGTPKLGIELLQEFGTGGSATVSTVVGDSNISTAWARYSFTTNAPSISGKTVGANSSLRLNIWCSSGSTNNSNAANIGIQNSTFDIWGVQLERGVIASHFEQIPLTTELSLCQRYYYRLTPTTTSDRFGVGYAQSTTSGLIQTHFPVTMRIRPSALEQSGTASQYGLFYGASANSVCSTVPTFQSATFDTAVTIFTIGAAAPTSGAGVYGKVQTVGAYLGWSAEF